MGCLERSSYIINWLIYKKNNVTVCFHKFSSDVPPYVKDRINTPISNYLKDFNIYDLWIYSHYNGDDEKGKSLYLEYLKTFKNKLILLSMTDSDEIHEHKLNTYILDKTHSYIGNVWKLDKSFYKINNLNCYKFKLIPSFHESSNWIDGNTITPFKNKKNVVNYIGRLHDHPLFPRVRINSIVKLNEMFDVNKYIRIVGFGNEDDNKFVYEQILPDNLKNTSLNFYDYIKYLNFSKFSLCPKGFAPHITYRFHESMRSRCLIFSNKFPKDIEFYNPPKEFIHFVPYELDCSDIQDKIRYYMNNESLSETLTVNAYNYWEENSKIDYIEGQENNLEKVLTDCIFK